MFIETETLGESNLAELESRFFVKYLIKFEMQFFVVNQTLKLERDSMTGYLMWNRGIYNIKSFDLFQIERAN